MIEGLKPYPKTKNSGVTWLGEVPEHWDVLRSKRLFSVRNELARPNDIQLAATQTYGVIPQAEFERKVGRKVVKILMHLEKRRHVEKDDFVISMRSFQGGLERAWSPGCIRSSYVVIKSREKIETRYFSYLFKTQEYINALRSTGNFIRDGQDLNYRNFCLVDLPVVPIEEQRAIADFLDYADRLIRRYILAKRKLVALLSEQRQAIIHQAITRGLNSDVKLKPSAVEWLGDIPAHWTLKRFKFLAKITSGQVDPRDPVHRSKILVAPNHIKSACGVITHQETAEHQGADSGKYEVRKGQIIYSKIRPNLRKAALATCDCLCSADMYPISPAEQEIRSAYLLLLLLSAPFTKYAVDCSLRVAMPKVNREALGESWMWYPGLEEQDAILRYIDETSRPSMLALSQTEREIFLIHEYRTRLIADVVTGKLDVREAAACLPEVDEEPDLFDEVDESFDDEALDETDLDDAVMEAQA